MKKTKTYKQIRESIYKMKGKKVTLNVEVPAIQKPKRVQSKKNMLCTCDTNSLLDEFEGACSVCGKTKEPLLIT